MTMTRFAFMYGIHNRFKNSIHVFTSATQITVNKVCRTIFKSSPVLRFRFLACQKEQRIFILNKLGDQRGLANPAPSI